MVACMRIGTVPQVTVNRSIYNVQIVEKLDLLGDTPPDSVPRRARGRQPLLQHAPADVPPRSIRTSTTACEEPADRRARPRRAPAGHRGCALKAACKSCSSSTFARPGSRSSSAARRRVFNITVADNHNYIVFTERYTPVLVNNCHAAIIARELGVPAVVGCEDATDRLKDGAEVTVSCAEGDTGYIYAGKLEYEVVDLSLDHMPSIPVKIAMNVGNPQLAFDFAQIPNDGVGLARLEFIISNTIGIHPKACLEFDRLAPELKAAVAKQARGYEKPGALLRREDRGGRFHHRGRVLAEEGDRAPLGFKSNEYRNLIGGAQYEPNEENPMLGFRGASRYIAPSFRDCFDLECEAMRKVRDTMGLTNVELMIPFVRTVKEGEQVLAILKEYGLERGRNALRVVMMCEIPSNAILADEFLKHFDGFSIGSNDMTQLTLALDRDSGLVMEAFDERDAAVKRMLHLAIQACRKAGKYVGICGQGRATIPTSPSGSWQRASNRCRSIPIPWWKHGSIWRRWPRAGSHERGHPRAGGDPISRAFHRLALRAFRGALAPRNPRHLPRACRGLRGRANVRVPGCRWRRSIVLAPHRPRGDRSQPGHRRLLPARAPRRQVPQPRSGASSPCRRPAASARAGL
jgi:pyruvate,water dikinase